MHHVKYAGKENGGFLSYDLWKDAPLQEAMEDPNCGILLNEDFAAFGGPVAANVGSHSGRAGSYKSFEDTNVSFGQLATGEGGGVRYTGYTTDNLEANMQAGYGVGAPFKIVAGGARLWAEFMLRKEVVTNTLGFLTGLAIPGATGNSLIADAGNDIADIGFIGFFSKDTDGDAVEFIYQVAGQAFVTVGDGVSLSALVAATSIRLGFHFDGARITPWVNGFAIKTHKVNPTAIAAATFPDATALNFLHGVKQGTNVAQYCDLLGYAVLQER